MSHKMFRTRGNSETSYRETLRKRLELLPFTAPPAPWKLAGGSFIGGLSDVGYVPDTDDVLAVSAEGRILFDASTGKRLSHDPADIFQDDPCLPHRTAPAIGKHTGVCVTLAGRHGGGLSRFTDDGWTIDIVQLPWPSHFLFLSAGYLSVTNATGDTWKLCDDNSYTFRAAGFSPTGRSFVFATSGEIVIFSRALG
ncbi:hypothetical protein SH528x_002135 [Novipirellula sp. SH528]|uniref:hypothetical protein n=1 Tax=Novipirellula sp. SH528 TaxID=3454466 RepID=UPI003F9FF252